MPYFCYHTNKIMIFKIILLIKYYYDITMYLLADNCYKKDINRTNPLGMRGRMAEEIADIMHKLWRETPQSFAPIKFRVRDLA